MKAQFKYRIFFALLIAVIMITNGLTKSVTAASDPAQTDATTAAPTNDNFAGAKLLAGSSGSVNGTNVDATKEAGEPSHAANKGGASVWYRYVAAGNGVLTVNCAGLDTLLAVYTGSSLATLELVAANDDRQSTSGGGISSLLHFGTQNSTTYYIAIDGKNHETDSFTLEYTFANSLSNDVFGTAISNGGMSTVRALAQITGTNVGAGKEAGEPNHAGNPGGRSVWFRLPDGADFPRAMTFSVTARRVTNAAQGMKTLMAIYTGTNVANLTPVASRQFTGFGTITMTLLPNTDYYIALDGFDSGQGAETGNFSMTYGMLRNDKSPDFDRDGITDLTVFRPSTGTWYSQDSITGNVRALQFGANGDKPVVADFDQDGKTDYAVFRPDTGVWYLNSSTNGFQAFSWGIAGDIPLVRTVNVGSTRVQAATVFRPTTGTWYTYALGAQPVTFGQLGDVPFSEDFSGDGTDEFAVFRPSNGTCYILNTVANQFSAVQFGAANDKPVVADFDGDGRADIAVFRPGNGTWYLINSHDNSFKAVQWGQAGDRPQVPHLYNDARLQVGVYRNGTWYFRHNIDGSLIVAAFGNSTDIPLSNPVQ